MCVGTRPNPRGGASKARVPFLEDRTYKGKELGVGVRQQELKLERQERSLQRRGFWGVWEDNHPQDFAQLLIFFCAKTQYIFTPTG